MMNRRLAFLGPAGTYSEQAAIDHDKGATLLPFASIPAVAAAVDSGLADEGVVPIENSLEGAVTHTLDLLVHESTLFVRHELALPIHHCLLVKPGTKTEEIKAIHSHPQALAQCRSFLGECFPDVGLVVEYHGHQHYIFPNAWHYKPEHKEAWHAMLERDRIKKEMIEASSDLTYLGVRFDDPLTSVDFYRGLLRRR